MTRDERYDAALAAFAEAVLDPTRAQGFLDDFTAFPARIADSGALNSLAQTLIKIAAPGVPDFYQGTELWDLSLVDPDNRRPVNYEERRRLLEEVTARRGDDAALARRLLDQRTHGRVKLFTAARALRARSQLGSVFSSGAY